MKTGITELENKLVISGMGIISPFGLGVNTYENALRNNLCAIRNISDTHPEHSQILPVAGFLPWTSLMKEIGQIDCDEAIKKRFIQLASRSPLAVQASMLTALEAYQQAKIYSLTETEKIGILVTGTNTTLQQTYEQHTIFLNEPEYVSSRYALNFLDSSHIGYISELLNITGEGHVVGAASASGNMAIIQAMRLVELGVVDQCLVIGVLAELSPLELKALRQLNVLGGVKYKDKPKEASRPFDQEHEGFIPGQISGCLVIEHAKSATRRNAPILGYLLGSGVSLDANHSSNPNMTGEASAMRKALKSAAIEAEDINYINAHGTSSILGDEVECRAICSVFDNNRHKIYINSTKGLIGHGLWSAGIAEAIAVLLQINGSFLHSNLNLKTPISEINGLMSQFDRIDNNLEFALSNNFAFGGINTSVIFHKGELR